MATEDEALEQIKGILGEHFQHYAFVVQYDDGSIWGEGDNELVTKALHEEALMMIKQQREWEDSDLEIVWDDDDEDDGEEWKTEEEYD
jgi:hypothetical protein